MSLTYLIDGYNVVKHSLFPQQKTAKAKDVKRALLDLIALRHLAGSVNNRVIIVFDGYPEVRLSDTDSQLKHEARVIFSRDETADERIKKMIAGYVNPKTTVVVSDDKEIRSYALLHRVRILGAGEFLSLGTDAKRARKQDEVADLKLNYTQMHAINQELKKIWLK